MVLAFKLKSIKAWRSIAVAIAAPKFKVKVIAS